MGVLTALVAIELFLLVLLTAISAPLWLLAAVLLVSILISAICAILYASKE